MEFFKEIFFEDLKEYLKQKEELFRQRNDFKSSETIEDLKNMIDSLERRVTRLEEDWSEVFIQYENNDKSEDEAKHLNCSHEFKISL